MQSEIVKQAIAAQGPAPKNGVTALLAQEKIAEAAALRSIREIIVDLSKPIAPRRLKTRK
jgi:hypothetical protein